MNEKIIAVVLSEQKEEIQKYKRSVMVPRKEEELFEWDSDMAQVVTGVRRSGKSTLCHLALQHHGVRYAYVNLDDDRLLDLKTEDLNTVLSCIYQIYGTDIEYLFLDEIQDVRGWHLFVNRLLRQGMHIFITGSNAKLLSGELATHLTGRYNEIKLYPFSFSEYCSAKYVDTKSITTKADAARKIALREYLQEGGFPEFTLMTNVRLRKTYVEGLIETIISKDIVRRFKLRNAESLRRIAHHLINNTCQVIDYVSLAGIAGLKSAATAQKYASYLAQAYLIHRVQKFSYKSRVRITEEKSYVVDPGFIANRENSLLGEDSGWHLENAVFIELMRRNSSLANDIYYYKPSTRQKEVDFVICTQSVVQELIQVAYSVNEDKTFKRETDALVLAGEKLGCKVLKLICSDQTRTITVKGVKIQIINIIDWLLM